MGIRAQGRLTWQAGTAALPFSLLLGFSERQEHVSGHVTCCKSHGGCFVCGRHKSGHWGLGYAELHTVLSLAGTECKRCVSSRTWSLATFSDWNPHVCSLSLSVIWRLVPPVGISSHGELSDSPDAMTAGPESRHLLALHHFSRMSPSLSTGLFLGCSPVVCPFPAMWICWVPRF